MNVIYMDPPWAYDEPGFRKGGEEQGLANIKYKTMGPKEIASEFSALVDEWSGEDCALFMWATWPKLPEALWVAGEWGFRYVTVPWVWAKGKKRNAETVLGLLEPTNPMDLANGALVRPMGFHTSIQTEPVLLFKKGSVGGFRQRLSPQVLFYPRREHSRKPDEFRDLIDTVAYPEAERRVEVFSRRPASPGWEVYGNETDKFVV